MSDDGLDSLLEELDAASPARAKRSPPSTLPVAVASPPKMGSSKGGAGDNSIDDLLDDLDSTSPLASQDDLGKGFASAHRASEVDAHVAKPVVAGGGGRKGKCYPVYLGGTDCDLGMSPGRACDALRCTKCDFDVIRIVNVKWSDKCDYMFFRNYYPNLDKLKANMVTFKGFCSYACQCTWRSTDTLDSVGSDTRWICSGHSS